jgi:hypothetical protein
VFPMSAKLSPVPGFPQQQTAQTEFVVQFFPPELSISA